MHFIITYFAFHVYVTYICTMHIHIPHLSDYCFIFSLTFEQNDRKWNVSAKLNTYHPLNCWAVQFSYITLYANAFMLPMLLVDVALDWLMVSSFQMNRLSLYCIFWKTFFNRNHLIMQFLEIIVKLWIHFRWASTQSTKKLIQSGFDYVYKRLTLNALPC